MVRRAGRRVGFTLVEILVVIVIIALVAAMLLGAVTKVLALQARTETLSDISKMQQSLEAARAQYNNIDYFPSQLILFNDMSMYSKNLSKIATAADQALAKQTANVLRAMFGRRLTSPDGSGVYASVTWGGTANTVAGQKLKGCECLTFYLGGMPLSGQCTGFSINPRNPTQTGGDRKGPFYQFKSTRLVATSSGYFRYLDPYGLAFAYFGAYSVNNYNSGDAELLGAPYTDSTSATTKYLNPNTYQIVSAGKDMSFGTLTSIDPKVGCTDINGQDNLANFSQSDLGNPIE